MIAVIVIFLLLIVLVSIQLPAILRKKSKKDVALYIGLVLLGFVLNAGYFLQVKLFNPSDWILFLFRPLSDWVYKILA